MKLNKYIFLIILLLLNLTLFAQTKDKFEIDFKEAWNIAQNHNPELFESKHSLDMAAKDAETYLDAYIPQISSTISTDRSSNIFSDDNLSETDRWSLSAGLSARLNLSPTLSYNQRMDILEFKQLRINTIIKEKSLYSQLQKIWLRIHFAKEESEILQGDLTNAQNRLSRVLKQYNRGLVSQRDLLSARLSVARIKPEIERQNSQIERLYLDLKYMLGYAPEVIIKIKNDNPDEPFLQNKIPSDAELRELIPWSLQLQKSYIDISIREEALKSTIVTYQRPVPSTGLSLGVDWNNNFTDIASGDAFNIEKIYDSFKLSFGVNIPISAYIPDSSENKRIISAKENLSLSKRNSKNTLINQLNKLSNLLLDIHLAEINKELNKLSLELQRQDYDISKQNYNAGSLSLLELDEALQSLRDAELSYRQQEQSYLFLLIDLKELISSK